MINTYSAFNYGHTITIDNLYFPINEGDGIVNVELNIGAYSLGEFVSELSRALNEYLDNEYTVSLDRSTGQITITTDQAFSIPLSSSTLKNVSCYGLAGFSGEADLTGEVEYEGNARSGYLFEPQFKLQS